MWTLMKVVNYLAKHNLMATDMLPNCNVYVKDNYMLLARSAECATAIRLFPIAN